MQWKILEEMEGNGNGKIWKTHASQEGGKAHESESARQKSPIWYGKFFEKIFSILKI